MLNAPFNMGNDVDTSYIDFVRNNQPAQLKQAFHPKAE